MFIGYEQKIMFPTWIFMNYAYLMACLNSSSKPSDIDSSSGELVDFFDELWFAALTVAIPFGPGGGGGGGAIGSTVFDDAPVELFDVFLSVPTSTFSRRFLGKWNLNEITYKYMHWLWAKNNVFDVNIHRLCILNSTI